VRDDVPLGELEVHPDRVVTILHVQGGGEAILVSSTWRQGDFEVFDFEVRAGPGRGLHNVYVRGERSDAAGVLVHNSTKVDDVLQESADGVGNFGSAHKLNADEALDAGEQWVGEGYNEMGPSGSGVFRSADGTKQFRMTDADLDGAHGDIGSHVHFERVNPNRAGRAAIEGNNHVELLDE